MGLAQLAPRETPVVDSSIASDASEDAVDKRLVALIQTNGDQAATAELYERCLPEISAGAYSLLRNPHDAEEAAHDAFEKALTKLERFDVSEPAPFRAWLRSIARRRCLDMLRKGGGVEMLSLEALDAARAERMPDGWQQRAASRLADGLLLSLLKGLPRSQHEVLALDCLGFETEEIASRLDRSPGAVRILRHRGLRALRERLGVE